MRHLISLKEQSKQDLLDILNIAQELKKNRNTELQKEYLKNKTLIMLFQKSSTRTRLSFEAGMTELGGHAIYLDSQKTQFSLTDFRDEIRAVMRYGQVLMFRAMKSDDVITAASFNQIPVIDACSEKYHPCQALGDMLTMIEHSNGLENVKKVTWLGIENNVSNTLKLTCSKLGVKFVLASPEAHPVSVDPDLNAQADASGLVEKTLSAEEGVKDADYVHTDTWMDMEFFNNGIIKPDYEVELERRKKVFAPYQLNAKLIDNFAPNAKIMHCMPCHIGYEITSDAVNHKNSVIFDQAENRMHIQKAIILWLLGMKA
jgi:ornithine carbamoyltransferase